MSTAIDNHIKAPTTLSLSASAASFDFSKPFTLVSADGHPFSVDPLKLPGTSNVFADMLSSGGGYRTCTLSEKKEAVEAYLAAIEGSLESVSITTWLTLLRMSDKYEAPVVRSALCYVASNWLTSKPQEAYIAASSLGIREMAEAAALPALAQSGTSSRPEQGAKAFLSELSTEKYRLAYLAAQNQLLLSSRVNCCTKYRCETQREALSKIWALMTRSAAAEVNYSTPLCTLLVRKMQFSVWDWPDCRGCLAAALESIEGLLDDWETGPSGKKSVKLFD